MASSLAEYLKKYASSGPSASSGDRNAPALKGKKKKTKKKKAKDVGKESAGVKIVDDDAVWYRETQEEEDLEDEDADAPAVLHDIEVKRQARIEQVKTHKPYLSIGEDGSGWVTLDSSENKDVKKAETYSHSHPSDDHPHLEEDISPPRKRRHDSVSPERYDPKGDNEDGDLSPPRKRQAELPHESREDSSSQRERVFRGSFTQDAHTTSSSRDLSPPRRRVRHDSASPKAETSSPDISPPRRARHDSASPEAAKSSPSDLSPPRRSRKDPTSPKLEKPSSTDLSPPRRRHDASPISKSHSPDLSPPRRGRHDSSLNFIGKDVLKEKREKGGDRTKENEEGGDKEKRKGMKFALMGDGSASGLRTGREITEDIKKKQLLEKERFSQLDASLTGQGAKTVYRDKHGKISNLDVIMLEGQAKKKELPPPEWGKGLVQKREKEEMRKYMEEEKDKPFALYRDDPRLDREMKERIRFGDPMAHLIKKKSLTEEVLLDYSKDEEMLKSGFVIPQTIPPHSWLKRKCDIAPNRYGIKPGRHWDGVDRSNGFEQNLFKQKNERRALEQDAYQWSVADM